MSQETIYFMLHKILDFEKFEDRIFDLENKNVELQANCRILTDQLDKLTQNGKKSGKGSEIQTQDQSTMTITDTDTDTGLNFIESNLENDKISTNQDQEMNFDQTREISIEMNTTLNGSQDENEENCDSDLTRENIKSEEIEKDCTSTSNMNEANDKKFPASTSPKISSEKQFQVFKSNVKLFTQYQKKVPKILQNIVIPLKRVDLDPKYQSKFTFLQYGSKDGQNMTCSFCRKEFQKFANFSRHLRIHTGENLYNCPMPMCSKSFASLKRFSQHCIVHSKAKAKSKTTSKLHTRAARKFHSSNSENLEKSIFECHVCSKLFKFKDNLNVHLRVHSGEKPFSCSDCPKKFTQKGSLNRHRLVHSGELPYGCQFCPKFFRVKSQLDLHISNHTEERPYECSNCLKKFICKSSLNLHNKLIKCSTSSI